ncbi:hypothetical protein EI94DRAFT_751089 [Lactarius quietus]|nr:hypothetical protein EI94DRAFT_751089 [Lactarius quietus]
MDGGSGTLCFEKLSDLPLARMRHSSGPELDAANGGGRSNDAVTCDGVTVEGLRQRLIVPVVVGSTTPGPPRAATARSVAAMVGGGGGTVSAWTPMATAEVGATPAPFPLSSLAVNSANCACSCRTCSARSGVSLTCVNGRAGHVPGMTIGRCRCVRCTSVRRTGVGRTRVGRTTW